MDNLTQEEALAILRRDREERERKKQNREREDQEAVRRQMGHLGRYFQAQAQHQPLELIVPPTTTALAPTLPDSIRQIFASGTQLTSLPSTLPANLLKLDVSNTRLTSLPTLPNNLQDLDISNTQITKLPILPSQLRILRMTNVALEDVPVFPENVTRIEISLLPNPKRNPRFDAIVEKYNADRNVAAFKQAIAEEKRNVYKVGTMKKVSAAMGGPEYLGPLLSTYTTGLPYSETAKRTKELEKKGGKKTRRRNMRKKRTLKRKARRT